MEELPQWKHELPKIPHKLLNDTFNVVVEYYKEHLQRDTSNGRLMPTRFDNVKTAHPDRVKGLPTILQGACFGASSTPFGLEHEVTGWPVGAGVAEGVPVAPTGQPVIVFARTWAQRLAVHAVAAPARCRSKQVPSRSIAQATLSRRSATERKARA